MCLYMEVRHVNVGIVLYKKIDISYAKFVYELSYANFA